MTSDVDDVMSCWSLSDSSSLEDEFWLRVLGALSDPSTRLINFSRSCTVCACDVTCFGVVTSEISAAFWTAFVMTYPKCSRNWRLGKWCNTDRSWNCENEFTDYEQGSLLMKENSHKRYLRKVSKNEKNSVSKHSWRLHDCDKIWGLNINQWFLDF